MCLYICEYVCVYTFIIIVSYIKLPGLEILVLIYGIMKKNQINNQMEINHLESSLALTFIWCLLELNTEKIK